MRELGAHSALIVVDIQNDFADPGGSLYVEGGEKVVSVANQYIGLARVSGSAVMYTQDWHPETTPHFAKDGGIWPVHCVAGTWGAGFHPDLHVEGEVIRKGVAGEDGYSGFSVRDPQTGDEHATRLGGLLLRSSVEHIVIVGLAGDYCVLETALDARRLGFAVEVPLEATRFVLLEQGDDERAVARMTEAGVEVA